MAKYYGSRKKKLTAKKVLRKAIKCVIYTMHPKKFVPCFTAFACFMTSFCWLIVALSSMGEWKLSENLMKPDNWSGPFKPNDDLQQAARIQFQKLYHPKSVLYNWDSQLVYVLESGGKVVAIQPDFHTGQPGAGKILDVCYLPGNPVGMRQTMGLLFVADSSNGVYSVDHFHKKARVIIPLDCVSPPITSLVDLTIAWDGTIYMLDSNNKYPATSFTTQLLEGSCTGRLIKYSASTRKSKVFMEGLCVPSGVDITLHNRLLIAEAGKGRVNYVRLNNATVVSSTDVPGVPGRIRTNDRGSVWLTLHPKKEKWFQYFSERLWLRKLITSVLPQSFLRSIFFHQHAVVTEVHQNGTPIDSLHDSNGKMFDWINDVTEGHDGQLFLTNDGQSFLGKLGEKDFSFTGSGEKINDDFKHGQGSDKTSL